MCGIGGFSGNFDPNILSMMGASMEARGRDASGSVFFSQHDIGLVHRRLSILDLSPAANQPMTDKSNGITITYNGELYNFKNLKAGLIKLGHSFRSCSDTEVILKLYVEHGVDCVKKMNGIYAFAIWDENRKYLFLARDGMGVKPLYYSSTDKGFIFASEIKAILQERSIPRSLNLGSVHSHMLYLWSPSPDTVLESVKKLEPGCAMIVREGSIESMWQHYTIPIEQDIVEQSESQIIEQVQAQLLTSVKSQMISDVPLGAFLSGGLDSSSIVAMVRKIEPEQKFDCFTINYPNQGQYGDGMAADLPFARKVADYLNVDLNVLDVSSNMMQDLEKAIYYLDEPQGDPAAINTMYISQLARDNGIKVLLSGAGGDDVFSGYRRHFALLQERYWAWQPKTVRKLLKSMSSVLSEQRPFTRRVQKALRFADLDSNERLCSYFYWLSPDICNQLFSSAHSEHLLQNQNPLMRSLAEISPDTHPLNKMLFLEMKHFLADHNLNYTDKMGMSAGVEIRVPFLDPELVSLACRLPVGMKYKRGHAKWVLKKAMEPFLPKDVIYRPKTGFGVPLRQWLRHDLVEILNDTLSVSSLQNRGIFNPQAVRNMMDMNAKGKFDYAYPLYSMMCFELWCRIFIDKEYPSYSDCKL